jgi:hypothetical protein
MKCAYEGTGVKTGNTELTIMKMTDDEKALFDNVHAPYADDNTSLWLQAGTSVIGWAVNAGPADTPASFSMYDRFGRVLVARDPSGSQRGHPIQVVMGDGKPALMFGKGGSGDNVLDDSVGKAGDIVGDGGVTDVATLKPGSWSYADKFMIPLPSATIAMTIDGVSSPVTFPAATGGAFLGSRADANYFRLYTSSGVTTIQLKNGTNAWNSATSGYSYDFRDSTWHDRQVVYDAAADTLTMWVDGTQVGQVTGVTQEIVSDADVAKIHIGGIGKTTTSPRFVGFIRQMHFVPDTSFADTTKRGYVRAVLNA